MTERISSQSSTSSTGRRLLMPTACTAASIPPRPFTAAATASPHMPGEVRSAAMARWCPVATGGRPATTSLARPALASMTATWASCPANALAIWCPRPPAPATTTLVPDRPRPADAGGEIIDGVEDQHLAQDLLARCDIREQVDELPIVGGVADDIGVREVRSPHHSFRGAGDEVGGQCDRIAERRPLA